jgi:hypothetical protein
LESGVGDLSWALDYGPWAFGFSHAAMDKDTWEEDVGHYKFKR